MYGNDIEIRLIGIAVLAGIIDYFKT